MNYALQIINYLVPLHPQRVRLLFIKQKENYGLRYFRRLRYVWNMRR